jgi:hypothetical protein
MKKSTLILLAVLAFGLVMSGCKKDEPAGPSIPGTLVGKWGYTSGVTGVAYEFTSDGKVIVGASAATTYDIAVTGNNTAGTIEVTASLADVFTGNTVDYEISADGKTLTLSNGSGALWYTFSLSPFDFRLLD